MSSKSKPPSVAPPSVKPPFDCTNQGDFVIQTSDGAKFRVHRNILSVASPVFEGMLDIPQPTTTEGDKSILAEDISELQFVDLSEDAETIDTLLRCIYPVPKPEILHTNLAAKVTLAAEKYFISTACLTPVYSHLRRAMRSTHITQNAGTVFALGWRLNYKDIAIRASRVLLAPSNDSRFSNRLPLITSISGDVEAQEALQEARNIRDEGILKATVLLNCRIGASLCRGCTGNYVKLLKIYEQAKRYMMAITDHEWAKKMEVGKIDLGACADWVEQAMKVRTNCQVCKDNKPYPLLPPTDPVKLHTVNTIAWPADKPDNSY